jgi:hypothetical protein
VLGVANDMELFPLLSLLSPLSSLLPLFLLPFVIAEKYADISPKPQTQPPSCGSLASTQKTTFARHVRSYQAVNKEIPPVCEDTVRVATFDVNNLVDLLDKGSNSELLREDLKELDPTVLVFQSVPASVHERHRFDRALESLGYIYRAFCREDTLGNMIASQVPLRPLFQIDLGQGSCLLTASILVGGKEIAVVGTKLSTKPEYRVDQANKVVKFIDVNISIPYVLAVSQLAGWESPEARVFYESGKYREPFRSLGVAVPNYTCWNGMVEDFLFTSASAEKSVVGAYTFQTVSSGHLPVAVDLRGYPEISHHNSRYEKRIWMGIFGATFLILLVVIVPMVYRILQ